MKKKLLNKTLALGITAALALPFAFSSGKEAKAATTPTTGAIEYSLLDDDGKTFVKSNNVVFTNLSGNNSLVDYTTAWGYKDLVPENEENGNKQSLLKKSGLNPGKYAITAKVNTNTTVTSFIDVKASNSATKVKAIALPTKDDVDLKKSGKISGAIKDGTTVKEDAIIIVKNKNTAWITKTDKNGMFTVFVPSGAYDIIVDTDNNKKNRKYSIKVQAGQNNLPFEDFGVDKEFIDGNDKNLYFGLNNDKENNPSVNASSKEYKGQAVANSTVRAYTVKDGIYTLIGETVTKKGKGDATNGDFSIKLKEAQPGKQIQIVVEDEKLNRYIPSPILLGNIDLDYTPDAKAVYGKDINISFKDKSGALVNSISKIELKDGTGISVKTLSKIEKGKDGTITGDYKTSNGKITISSNTILEQFKTNDFTKELTFKLEVVAAGFNTKTIDQTIKPVNAPSLSATVAKATTEGIKLTATTKTAGNKIVYKVSDTSVDIPKLYTTVTGTTALTTSPADNIKTGIAKGKYLAVYEVNADSKVVKFKLIALTDANVKEVVAAVDAPAFTATAAAGSATGATAVTATAGAGNSLAYKVSSATVATPKVGEAVTGTSALTSGANITGVDAITNKFLAVYELDGSSKVVKFKLITLTATEINQQP